MGNQSSQIQKSEYIEDDDATRRSLPPPEDDYAFSSQLLGSPLPNESFPTSKNFQYTDTDGPSSSARGPEPALKREHDESPGNLDIRESKKSSRKKEKRKHKKSKKMQSMSVDHGFGDALDDSAVAFSANLGHAMANEMDHQDQAPTSPSQDRLDANFDAHALGLHTEVTEGDASAGTDANSSKKRKSKGQGKSERKKQKRNKKHSLDGFDHDFPTDAAVMDPHHDMNNRDSKLGNGDPTDGAHGLPDPDDNTFGDLATSLYTENMMDMNFGQGGPGDSFQTHVDDDQLHRQASMSSHSNMNGRGMDLDRPEFDIPIDPALQARARDANETLEHHQHLDPDTFGLVHDHSVGDNDYRIPSPDHGADNGGLVTSSHMGDPQLGPDELGLGHTFDHADLSNTTMVDEKHTEFATAPDMSTDIQVPSSIPPPTAMDSTQTPNKPPRSKASTGRKRYAKPTFQSQAEQENTDGFAELPSPTAAAASRKDTNDVGTTPSNSTAKGKKTKSSSMLRSDGTRATPQPSGGVLSGPFSEAENQSLAETIERWRSDFNMTKFEINEFIQKNPKEAKSTEFWDRVVATCPGRKRQKVINLCRRKYHNFVARGSWTPEQHDELSHMWEMHGNKFTLIGAQINRHPEDVRDRIRNYVVCGDKRRKDAWDQEEEDRLAQIVAEALTKIQELRREDNDQQHPGVADEDLIDWQLVSEQMDRTRSRLQCITKWKLVKSQLDGGTIDGEVLSVEEVIKKARDEAKEMSSRERFNVVKAIRACGANADSRIPWAKIRAEKVGNKWTRATLMVVWRRLKSTVPDWRITSVPDIAEQLCNNYQQTSVLELPDDSQIELDTEYIEIEHKVSKILRAHATPKTPRVVGQVDDEDEAMRDQVEKAGSNNEDDEVAMSDIVPNPEGRNSVELGVEQGPETIENSDVEKTAPTNGDAPTGDDEISDNLSISEFRPPKTPNAETKTADQVTPQSNGLTPQRFKKSSSVANSARRQMGKKRKEALPNDMVVDDASSDTNASDVESIPAHAS